MNETTTMNRFGLVGAGGFGREVMPLWRLQVGRLSVEDRGNFHFVAEDEIVDCALASDVNGVPLCKLSEFMGMGGRGFFNVAIGDSRARERIAVACEQEGLIPQSIVAQNVVDLDCNEIGAGAILSPFVMVTANAKIGRFFHANIYSYVAHDCVIGDYVTFAPGVKCNGHVHIGDHAYIGTGAILRPGTYGKPLVIGAGATIGMGAVVTKDVLPGAVVVGNPARPMEKK